MTLEPKILVVLPIYNAREYLEAALFSVLSQNCDHYSILAIDDGSTDNSLEILTHIKDERLIVIHQENQGLVNVLNRGLKYASDSGYSYYARMDADDISHPDRLSKQYTLLRNNADIAACSCNCEYINLSGEIIGNSTVPLSSSLIEWEIKNGLRGMVHGSLMIRTQVLAEIGGYRQQFIQAEDTDLFFRLIEQHKMRNLAEFLYQIRLHNPSRSLQQSRLSSQYSHYAKDCYKRRKAEVSERTFEDFLARMGLYNKLLLRREYLMLRLWRQSMSGKKHFIRYIAGILDPMRAFARILRRVERNYFRTID